LEVLREADICLVIIPAHTSHILQLLDFRLNGIVKEEFGMAWMEAIPAVLLVTAALRPKKGSSTSSLNHSNWSL